MNYKNIKIRLNIKTEEIDNSLIIFNLDNGGFYELEGTAKEIWKMLEENITFDDIVKSLEKKYGCSSTVKEDSENFIAQILERELITIE